MEEPAETREETNDSRGFGIYALWAGVVLVLYVLSWGPFMMVAQKNFAARRTPNPNLMRPMARLYRPLGWAYAHTPLHKPLGMYLHLWSPQAWDKNGDINGQDSCPSVSIRGFNPVN